MESPFPKTLLLQRSLPSIYAMSSPLLSPKLVGFFLCIFQDRKILLVLSLTSLRWSRFCVQVNHQRLTRGINMRSSVLYMHCTFTSSELLTKSSTNRCLTFAKRYFAVCFFTLHFSQNVTCWLFLSLLPSVGSSHHTDCKYHLVSRQFPHLKDRSGR